jgi:hypothetical protein
MKGRTAANAALAVLHHATTPDPARGTMAESFLAALDPNTDQFTFQLFSDGGDRYAEIIHGAIHDLWGRALWARCYLSSLDEALIYY